MRVLLVEDEIALNEIAVAQMERLGHSVQSSHSIEGAEAILAEHADAIDCIIADHRLPDGMGVALCVQCKVRYPRMAIGVVSACLTRDDRELLEEYKIPYWRKPVLYSKVMEAMVEFRRPPVAMDKLESAPVLDRPIVAAPPPPPPPPPRPKPVSPTGDFWPGTFDPKQRLNHTVLTPGSPSRHPMPPDEAGEPAPEPEPKPGFTRRLFSFRRGGA